MNLRTASIPELLAAYRAEEHDTAWSLTLAQNIAERLIAQDVFGRLAALRDRLELGLGNGATRFDELAQDAHDTIHDLLTRKG